MSNIITSVRQVQISDHISAVQSPCKLIVCTDWRFLSIDYPLNAFLKSLRVINGFYVYVHRWNRSRAMRELGNNPQLLQFIDEATSILRKFDVAAQTTISITGTVGIHLPNQA